LRSGLSLGSRRHGIVEGDQIPYLAVGCRAKKENQEQHWIEPDPEINASSPVCRAPCTCRTVSDYQSANPSHMVFEYANTNARSH